jgi:hypothetical protein
MQTPIRNRCLAVSELVDDDNIVARSYLLNHCLGSNVAGAASDEHIPGSGHGGCPGPYSHHKAMLAALNQAASNIPLTSINTPRLIRLGITPPST